MSEPSSGRGGPAPAGGHRDGRDLTRSLLRRTTEEVTPPDIKDRLNPWSLALCSPARTRSHRRRRRRTGSTPSLQGEGTQEDLDSRYRQEDP
jgi:hypothetical protein